MCKLIPCPAEFVYYFLKFFNKILESLMHSIISSTNSDRLTTCFPIYISLISFTHLVA